MQRSWNILSVLSFDVRTTDELCIENFYQFWSIYLMSFHKSISHPHYRASPIDTEEVMGAKRNSGGHPPPPPQLYYSPSLQSFSDWLSKWWGQRWTLTVTLPQLYHSPSLQGFSDWLWVSDVSKDELWKSPIYSSTVHTVLYAHSPVFHSKPRTPYSDHIFKINTNSDRTVFIIRSFKCSMLSLWKTFLPVRRMKECRLQNTPLAAMWKPKQIFVSSQRFPANLLRGIFCRLAHAQLISSPDFILPATIWTPMQENIQFYQF